MIVDPDFFEHWKTKALVELTKHPESPLWVQKLWAHCHTRKAWEFPGLSPLAVKSICGVSPDITPEDWLSMLVEAGFVRRKGKTITVHDWEKHNASLIQRWTSGAKPKMKRDGSGAQAEPKPQASDRDDRIDRDDRRDGGSGKAPPRASKPSNLQEVEAYADTLSLPGSEAAKFFDHFTANGWRQAGGNAIKDWQAALRNWGRRVPGFGKKRGEGGAGASAPIPFNPNTPNAHTGGLEVFTSVSDEAPPTSETNL